MELRNNEMMKHATIISSGVYQVEVSDVITSILKLQTNVAKRTSQEHSSDR